MALRDRLRTPTRAQALAAAGVSAAAAAAAYGTQRAHTRTIATDPENAVLSKPPQGRPLEIESADGTRLHAEIFGPESATTIVFAHGWTEALIFWTYQIIELSQELRVVAYDLRGHGASDPAATGDYSLARFGDDVEAVLGAVLPSGERAVIAGHSLGAMSIAAWAETYDVQARIRAAALLNTGLSQLLTESGLIRLPHFARGLTESISRHAFVGSRAPLPRISSPIQHAAIRYFAFGPSASPAQIAFYERMLIACPPAVRAAVGLAIADMDLQHALARLTVPTLVVAGEQDRLTPHAHARRIADALPNLDELVVWPATGHMGPLERPRELNAALRQLALSGAGSPAAV